MSIARYRRLDLLDASGVVKKQTVYTIDELKDAVTNQVPFIDIASGTYTVDEVMLPTAGTTIQGRGNVQLQAAATISGVGQFFFVLNDDVTIRNVTLDSNGNSSVNHLRVSDTGIGNILIDKCVFTGGTGTNQYIDWNTTSNSVQILNCQFENTTSTSDTLNPSGTDQLIDNCTFGSAAGSTSSINASTNRLTISNCQFNSSSGTAVTLSNADFRRLVTDCIFDDINAIGSLSGKTIFKDNTSNGCGTLTITGSNASVTIDSCTFESSSADAISASSSNEPVFITGNRILNPSGIGVTTSVEGSVIGNFIDSATNGVVLGSGFSGVCTGNRITNSSSDPISVSATNPTVRDNTIDTVTLTPASETTLSGTVFASATRIGLTGSGTLFVTETVEGDLVTTATNQRGISTITANNRIYISSNLSTTGTGTESITRADRLTVNGYNERISVTATSNPARVIVPDLTTNSKGHRLTITRTGTNKVIVHPNSYGSGRWREIISGTNTIDLVWNGQEWIDNDFLPVVAHLRDEDLFTTQGYSASTLTVVFFDTVERTSGGWSITRNPLDSTAVNQVTVPISGWYKLTCGIPFSTGTTNQAAGCGVRINETGNRYGWNFVVGDTLHLRYSTTAAFASAGDTLEVVAFNQSGGSFDTTGNNPQIFTVEYIGKG